MSIFLLVFDRGQQKLVEIREFKKSQLAEAEDRRFRAEVEALRTDRDLEIVTLEADSLAELRETHGSYFEDSAEKLTARLLP